MADTKTTTTAKTVLTEKTLDKAEGRGANAVKHSFKINCWPVGTGKDFISNAVEGLGTGFVARAIGQVLSIDARAAFVDKKDTENWMPKADGSASSGDGYASIRRDLRKKGVDDNTIEGIIENAKDKAAS